METKMTLYLSLVLFMIVFVIDYFFINKKKLKLLKNNGQNKKGKKKKVKPISEIDLMVVKQKLNKNKLNLDQVIIWVSFINSFIIASVSAVIMLMPFKTMWKLLIAFVLLFSLIYAIYEIYGRYLKRKEEK